MALLSYIIQGLESLIQINHNGTCLTCWASGIGVQEADLSRGLSLQSVRLEPRELCWPDGLLLFWTTFGAEPFCWRAGLAGWSLAKFCVLLLGVKEHRWPSIRSRWTWFIMAKKLSCSAVAWEIKNNICMALLFYIVSRFGKFVKNQS